MTRDQQTQLEYFRDHLDRESLTMVLNTSGYQISAEAREGLRSARPTEPLTSDKDVKRVYEVTFDYEGRLERGSVYVWIKDGMLHADF